MSDQIAFKDEEGNIVSVAQISNASDKGSVIDITVRSSEGTETIAISEEEFAQEIAIVQDKE